MRRIGRRVANALLWVAAAVGVMCGVLWIAATAGLVQPLVVVSGSMEPAIMTGDLLFATRVPMTDVAVGEVLTLPSSVTGKLVTHRVQAIEDVKGQYGITLKGDANDSPDVETYLVGRQDKVWRPALTISGGGRVVMAMTTPTVAIPLLAALLALIVLSLLPGDGPSRTSGREVADEAAEAVEPEGGVASPPDGEGALVPGISKESA